MKKPTKEIREANDKASIGFIEAGFNIFLMAVMFGGSAFLFQWAAIFVVLGITIHGLVRRGADATDWIAGKLPGNPFGTKKE